MATRQNEISQEIEKVKENIRIGIEAGWIEPEVNGAIPTVVVEQINLGYWEVGWDYLSKRN